MPCWGGNGLLGRVNYRLWGQRLNSWRTMLYLYLSSVSFFLSPSPTFAPSFGGYRDLDYCKKALESPVSYVTGTHISLGLICTYMTSITNLQAAVILPPCPAAGFSPLRSQWFLWLHCSQVACKMIGALQNTVICIRPLFFYLCKVRNSKKYNKDVTYSSGIGNCIGQFNM